MLVMDIGNSCINISRHLPDGSHLLSSGPPGLVSVLFRQSFTPMPVRNSPGWLPMRALIAGVLVVYGCHQLVA